MNQKAKENQITTTEKFYRRDRNGWKIHLGAWRIDEFYNLLNKISNHDFDQINLGEFWLVDDLLKSIHNIQLDKE